MNHPAFCLQLSANPSPFHPMEAAPGVDWNHGRLKKVDSAAPQTDTVDIPADRAVVGGADS